MRYELNDYEWRVIKPMLPNKPRGVPRADDRRVLNDIYLFYFLSTPKRRGTPFCSAAGWVE